MRMPSYYEHAKVFSYILNPPYNYSLTNDASAQIMSACIQMALRCVTAKLP